jgi:Ca2+-binding RTX toxin-like protein
MTVFTGGLGADSFYGTTGADTLSGLGGADSLNGNLGANQVNGGDGDDLITSTGGADTIDGGTGFDTWAGALGSSTANLTFAYDGSTGVGSLTGGTILSSIEIASLTTGTGNDVITIKHPGYALGQTFRGGTGSDTFAISDTGSPIASVAQIQSNGAGGFTGKFENVQFYDFESIDITLTDGTGSVYVNGAALAAGIKLTLDGGGGLDVLNIDFSAISSVNIDFSAPAISSNINNFSAKNFEQVILLLGTGNNNVIGTGAADIFYGETGNDTIDGGGDSDQISGGDGLNLLKGGSGDDIFHSTGMDTVDGGVGNDTWYGDYGAFKIPLAFSYDGASRVGFLPGGGTLAGVEVMNFTGGAGDDSVTLSNFSPQVASSFVGGAGHDTFAATFSGFSPIIIDTDLAGGLGGLVNGKISFRGFEVANIVLGQTGQGATVYTSALMTANKLTIDGGAKNYNDISIHFNTSDSINFDVSNNTSITNVPGLATLNFRSYILDLTASGSSHVIGGSGGDSITGGLGDDTLEGGGGNDTLLGGAGHNLLIGGGGDDSLASGDATSTFNGGAGIDTVDFSARSAAVHIDLGAPPGPGGDTLINVEQIIGSSWNDTVTGDAAANTLMGGAGDDVLDGAGSVDTASYASATSAVVVSLTLQGVAQNTQGAGSDTLKGF